MRNFYALLSSISFFLFTNSYSQTVSLTGPTYNQDFNTLALSGTSSTVPTGWLFAESGTNANTIYTAGTGSSNAGDTYSFGAASNTERSFGGLQSGSLNPTIGAAFTNNTGGTVTSLAINYTGEQWRLGATGRTDRIDFQYSSDATSLTTGTWTDVNNLDFSGPVSTGTVGPLDGNAAANRTAISFTITGLSIPNGATFYFRWLSFDAAGADDGLAIDDLAITPTSAGGNSIAINDVSIPEGNSGTTSFTFTVSLSSPAGEGGVSFDIATADNTAIAPGDYTSKTLTSQTIPAGSLSYSFTVLVNGDGTTESNETFFVNISNVTGATIGDGQGTGTILNDDCSPTHTVAQIQGSGNISPLNGNTVTTSGIVTGIKTNGFFLQMPVGDGNVATSDGIFVFTAGVPPLSVAVGNSLCITGTVSEFVPAANPNGLVQTELTFVTITLLSTGNALPAPVVITSSDTDPSGGLTQLEKYEGMRVKVNSLNVVAPTDGTPTETSATSTSSGFFYGVVTGVNRPFREPGIELPDPLPTGAPATVTRWDANPELIAVASRGLFNGTIIDVATGAVLTNLTGPLDIAGRYYAIDVDLPSTTPLPAISNNNLTFTAVPQQTNDELTVASFNLERFFDNVNDPLIGEPVLTATAYANRLNKASLAIRNVLRSPDVIGMIEIENLSVLQTLATKVNTDAVAAGQPNPDYTAYLVEGNDIGGIDVGFLVKSGRVNVTSVTQLGKNDLFINPNNGQSELLNDRPPLVLNATFNKPGCATPYPFTVIVNHLRSLNGIDDAVDGNRVRQKRKAQAEYLANLIQGFQTADPNAKIISVGDYNAFQFSDGYVDMIGTIKGAPTPAANVVLASPDLVNPNLTDLVDIHAPEQRYSYSFDGSAQVLDHILVNQNALNVKSRFAIARVDADFPEIYRNDANRPERISDHDAPVAYFLFNDVTAPVAICKPATVTLANGSATITATDVNNESHDECGPVTLAVSKTSFNCSNIGANTVTLTVTDGTGNTATCSATVTVAGVVPSCSVTAVPVGNVYTGGVLTNIYLGYGPQSVTLNVTATGGSSFTYLWNGSGLNCSACEDPVFTPTMEGIYHFTVTITNNNGCTTTCNIAICVLDIRVPGTDGKKVYICHAPPGNPGNGQTLAVNVNSVKDHLSSHAGDKLGQCGQDPCSIQSRMITTNQFITGESFKVAVLPNPSRSSFILSIESNNELPVNIRILDVQGREIDQLRTQPANSIVKIGNTLKSGFYLAEVIQGNEKKIVKLVKIH
jgi:predicted extracellular nuclease